MLGIFVSLFVILICPAFFALGRCEIQKKETIQQTKGIYFPLETLMYTKLPSYSDARIAFDPNGEIIATNIEDNNIILWDIAKTEKKASFEKRDEIRNIKFITYSPNGRIIAVKAQENTTLFDVETGKVKASIDHGYHLLIARDCFSPDGKILAIVSNYEGPYSNVPSTIRLLDVDSGKEIRTFEIGNTHAVAFSPDGKTLISASRYGAKNELYGLIFWDVVTGEKRATFNLRKDVSDLDYIGLITFSPEGQTLEMAGGSHYAQFSSGVLILWDLIKGEKKETFYYRGTPLAFSPDGKILASKAEVSVGRGIYINLIDVFTGTECTTEERLYNAIYSVAFSPDGKMLAIVASRGRYIELWDIAGLFYRYGVYKKGDFETMSEFIARKKEFEAAKKDYETILKKKRNFYSEEKVIYRYDADKEIFLFDIQGTDVCIKVSRDKAVHLREHKLFLQGVLTYFDSQRAKLIDAFILDEEIKDKFPIEIVKK